MGVHAFHIVIMWACLALLAVIVLAATAPWFAARLREFFGVGLIFAGVAVGFIYVGSTKHVTNAGADSGISLAYIDVATNDVPDTVVTVAYTNGVTASTPVWVRDKVTDRWTELEKNDASIASSNGVNYLTFTVPGTNYLQSTYWWVGSDTPPVVVESSGIEIVSFVCTSRRCDVSFTCSDPNCTAFKLQDSDDGEEWHDAAEIQAPGAFNPATVHQISASGFFVGRTRYWRVFSSYRAGGGQ